MLADANGITDDVDTLTGTIIHKNNGIKQPIYHWGDGEIRNEQAFVNFRMPVSPSGNTEVYAFGGFSNHFGTGNGFYRLLESPRNWPQIYPQGFLPEFDPKSKDYSVTGGVRTVVAGWSLDFGGSYGLNTFDYNLRNTLNPSLGPCLDVACAPGDDGILGTLPMIQEFRIRLRSSRDVIARSEYELGINGSKAYEVGLPAPLNVAAGVLFRGEDYAIKAGELASYINGGHLAQDSAAAEPSGLAPAGSSVFGGFRPQDASDHSRTNIGTYIDLETNLTPQFLANVAGRFEHYSDFGSNVSGKLALRYQPAKQFVIRGSLSNGFRAPGLPQSFFSHITTNFIGGQPFEVGNFPVDARAAQIFGAKPLKEEKSVNISSGIAYTPVENFTITLDYFHIKITDRILLGATFADTVAQDILADSGIRGDCRCAVLHERAGYEDRRRGCDGRLSDACGERNSRLEPQRELHAQQDNARSSPSRGTSGAAHRRSEHSRSRHDAGHRKGASGLARHAYGQLRTIAVPCAGARVVLRRIFLGATELYG